MAINLSGTNKNSVKKMTASVASLIREGYERRMIWSFKSILVDFSLFHLRFEEFLF